MSGSAAASDGVARNRGRRVDSQAGRINTGVLLREMIDLHRLADFPRPAFKTVQFSSYDRQSTLPGGPGWFANNDGFGGEEIPNFEAVAKEPSEDGIGEYVTATGRSWQGAAGWPGVVG